MSAAASLLDCNILFLGRAHFAWSIPSLDIGTNKLNSQLSQWYECWKTQPHLSNSLASDPMDGQRGIFVSQRWGSLPKTKFRAHQVHVCFVSLLGIKWVSLAWNHSSNSLSALTPARCVLYNFAVSNLLCKSLGYTAVHCLNSTQKRLAGWHTWVINTILWKSWFTGGLEALFAVQACVTGTVIRFWGEA